MKIRCFAWVRERVGRAEDEIEIPAGVETIRDLMGWLARTDPGYGAAFSEPEVIRAALDHVHVQHDSKLGSARELAFFPPMTGG